MNKKMALTAVCGWLCVQSGLYAATWCVSPNGSDYAIVTLEGFGGPDYVPVSGDYDGDGKADLVLYNSAMATWLFRLSSANYIQVSTTF